MKLYRQLKTNEEQPKEDNWYPTDNGVLYYFVDTESWSCRDDRLSIEYPWVWYDEIDEDKFELKTK